VLCEGAFESLMSGDRAKHDAIVEEKARVLAQEVDIIVLAQASMSRLAPDLTIKIGKQVLGSPRLAVEYIKKCFDDPELLK
jgi:Asp/Glu/hydantoin racemase